MLQTNICQWCGEKAVFKTIQKGYQEPEKFKIFHCSSCNTSFSMPRVNSDGIYELIYKNTKNVRGYCRYFQYKSEVLKQSNPLMYLANSEPSYWGPVYALKSILKTNKTARILEVGSGLGYYTYSFKKAGYNIQGLEISHEAVKEATKLYGDFFICDDLYNYADKNRECYDVIIMTEVIEHLSDPKGFINSVKLLLKRQGNCIITTPNKSFYPKETAWFSDAPPVHCWWFSEESIEYIANLYNMELNFVDYSKFYKKHPQIYQIKNIESEGQHVFDQYGNLIKPEISIRKFKIHKWIKRNKQYMLIRNSIIQLKYPNVYKKGNKESNIICAILTKN